MAKTGKPERIGISVYSAMKSETEKAMWQWMKENKPGFVMNTVVSILRHIWKARRD
jgi:hypothetical protein